MIFETKKKDIQKKYYFIFSDAIPQKLISKTKAWEWETQNTLQPTLKKNGLCHFKKR